jgi:hypothetical protein
MVFTDPEEWDQDDDELVLDPWGELEEAPPWYCEGPSE